MRDAAIQIVVLLNQLANAVSCVLLAPLSFLPEVPGGLIVAVLSGILLLIAFKYTSNQAAIKRVRNGIKAEFLALSLFKDSVVVNLVSQWQILRGALQLIVFSLIPIGCMVVPVTLLLGQLSLWWQARPLRVSEDVVVTVELNATRKSGESDVILQTPSDVEITQGPFTIRSKKEIVWQIRARSPGYHNLEFVVDGQPLVKELAVGSSPMRVSLVRPQWNLASVLLNPAEPPFRSTSKIRSISIQYPLETTWTNGQYAYLYFRSWLVFWFAVSTLAAFFFCGVLKVNL